MDYVQQTHKYGCFTACVSMLTGIDYDVLPIAPPATNGNAFSPRLLSREEWERYKYLPRYVLGLNESEEPVSIDEWIALLVDNGYSLSVTRVRPNVPCIRAANNFTHVVVWVPNEYPGGGITLNPATGNPVPHHLDETYFTITPVGA